MHLRTVFFVFLSSLFGATTSVQAAAGWSDFGLITEINEQPTQGVGAGQVFIDVAINGNPSGCTYPNGFYFTVSNDRTKRFYSTLLAAHLSGRPVSIWTSGVCHFWGYAELDGVRVR